MRVLAIVLGFAVALSAPLRSNRQLESAETTENAGMSYAALINNGLGNPYAFFDKHTFPANPGHSLSPSQYSAVTTVDACDSVTRHDNTRVSTKFVIADFTRADFNRKGSQNCAGGQKKVFVSTGTYKSVRCNLGSSGWSPASNSFSNDYICICAAGNSPNIEYHLASSNECAQFRSLSNI